MLLMRVLEAEILFFVHVLATFLTVQEAQKKFVFLTSSNQK